MVHNIDILSLKFKIYRLKLKLDSENRPEWEKNLTHKYLNEVLNCIEEIQLF